MDYKTARRFDRLERLVTVFIALQALTLVVLVSPVLVWVFGVQPLWTALLYLLVVALVVLVVVAYR